MTVSATIIVIRNDEEIEVGLWGNTERFGSYNPRESGERIGDWGIDSPANLKLTPEETDRAILALENEI